MSVADTVADKLDAALDRFHKALASTDDDEIGKAEDAVYDISQPDKKSRL